MSARDQATVSVIVPAYNAEAFVVRAVDSALAQTHRPLEVLVVDDGSSDQTRKIVAQLPSPVRLIEKENGGPASARNLGASQARGDWLAFLDADDWWFPEKLRQQLHYAGDPQVGMIHCLPDHRSEEGPPTLAFADMWDRNWIINSSVLIRRAAFHALGGFNEAKELISVEDYNLWIRVAASDWRIATCPRVLIHYTRGIGISSNSERFLRASLYNVDDIGSRLFLPGNMTDTKRNKIIVDFGRKALFDRDLPTARRLLYQAYRQEPSARTLLHLLAASMPARVLDIKRGSFNLLTPQSASPKPEAAPTTIAGSYELGRQCDASRRHASILDPTFHIPARARNFDRPVLITTVDAEEDFDWTRPISRAATSVTSMRSQHLAHRVFERHGAIPTYMVDYPVASKDEGRGPLRELIQSGACQIGAQLHPWVTPPFVENVSARNSYQGNLPAALEFGKIQVLTEELEAAFGTRPRIFRAGRYGVGPNTGDLLRHFGYEADSSVVPCWNFADKGGPDFRHMTAWPCWIDPERSLLELPVSSAIVGVAADLPSVLSSRLFGGRSEQVGLPSVLANLGLLERIKLTPEGMTISEAKRLVRHMANIGHKVFVLTYHSPSLEPGHTPYVRSKEDLTRFLAWLSEFYDYFTKDLGGICATWQDVRTALLLGTSVPGNDMKANCVKQSHPQPESPARAAPDRDDKPTGARHQPGAAPALPPGNAGTHTDTAYGIGSRMAG
jgi:glycosyltransferase involved in cell wall biosynthesis